MLLWGSLAQVAAAYQALDPQVEEAGLECTGENREWVYSTFGALNNPHVAPTPGKFPDVFLASAHSR